MSKKQKKNINFNETMKNFDLNKVDNELKVDNNLNNDIIKKSVRSLKDSCVENGNDLLKGVVGEMNYNGTSDINKKVHNRLKDTEDIRSQINTSKQIVTAIKNANMINKVNSLKLYKVTDDDIKNTLSKLTLFQTIKLWFKSRKK